jgi:hypothetical protein
MKFLLLVQIILGATGVSSFKNNLNILQNKLSKRLSLTELKLSFVDDVKADLIKTLDGKEDDLFICPDKLSTLSKVTRIFGFVEDKYFLNNKFGIKYKIRPDYYDLTIKSEINKNPLEMSSRERIGQKFFQIPLISWIYERGYRQNFKNFGFPGIEKEFNEAKEFFLGLNLTSTIVDLSCASGFMTRKFIKSRKYKINYFIYYTIVTNF